MIRRFIAVFGTLALAAAILPVMPESISAVIECCNGIMCPMHAAQVHQNCDMDASNSGAALKPCPVQAAAHYTAAMSFVLVAPTILHDGARSEAAIAFLPNFSPDAQSSVDSPPPRLLPAA
jgi:hypothetical protein